MQTEPSALAAIHAHVRNVVGGLASAPIATTGYPQALPKRLDFKRSIVRVSVSAESAIELNFQ